MTGLQRLRRHGFAGLLVCWAVCGVFAYHGQSFAQKPLLVRASQGRHSSARQPMVLSALRDCRAANISVANPLPVTPVDVCGGDAPQAVCGDGICEPQRGEHCGNCSLDCACGKSQFCQDEQCVMLVGTCGDSVCDAGQETCTTCPQDCLCPSDQTCQNNQCVSATPPPGGCTQNSDCPSDQTCQNGQCISGTPPPGGCTQNVDCPQGQICQNNQCIQGTQPPNNGKVPGAVGGPCREYGQCDEGLRCFVDTLQVSICFPENTPSSLQFCPYSQHFKSCDPSGLNCRFYCLQARGFGCQSLLSQPTSSPLWWLLLCLPFVGRIQRWK